MNCKKCGAPLTENDQFCKNCGEAVNSQSINTGDQTSFGVANTNTNNNLNQQPMDNNVQPSYSNNINNNAQPSYPNNMNNNQQQGWANYNNAPMYNNQPINKPSGNGKYIAIGFAILVGIIAVVLVISMVMSKDNNSNLTGGGSSNVTQPSKTNYKVAFKGFTFEIPDNFVYEEDNGTLMIGNEEGTWAAILELEQGSFAQLKANKNQLQSLMQQSGYTASIASEKNLGGVDFITLEISASGQNAIAALAKANSMYFIGVTAMNQDNEFDYKLLETIAPIVKSAQYNGNTTNNISGNTKIDMSAISELAK